MSEPEITPSDLKFRFQINKQLPASIAIYNPGSQRLAFKVKTTTPKKYVVRPSSGVVDPRTTANVQVIMQAQKEFPADFVNCKDKFLVQTTILGPGEDIAPDTFKNPSHKDTRIRVVIEGPPAPPSPVNEGDEDSLGNAGTAGAPYPLRHDSGPAGLGQENKELRARLEKLTTEYQKLQRKAETAGGKGGMGSPLMAVLPVLLVGIIAFLVGHFLKL